MILPPGLVEDAFDLETMECRVNLLAILSDTLDTVSRVRGSGRNLVFILSGPVNCLYSPGGAIPWYLVDEILIHPLNMENIGLQDREGYTGLKYPIREALIRNLEQAGFALEAGRLPSDILLQLTGDHTSVLKIRVYTPVEIGYSATLWNALDPGTSIYIGSPENLQAVREKSVELPGKRAIMAGTFIRRADIFVQSGRVDEAAYHLAAAAQVMGNTRLRIEINRAIAECRIEKEFPRFF